MWLDQGEVGKGTAPNAGGVDAEGVEEVEEVLHSAVLSLVGRTYCRLHGRELLDLRKTRGYGNSRVRVTCGHRSTRIWVLGLGAASTCHKYL
jgi:hypothetical protein